MNKNRVANKIKKVEQILNVAQEESDKLILSEVEEHEVEVVNDDEHLPAVPVENRELIFELTELKKSFNIAKRSLQQLVNYGQNLMAQTVTLELQDLKASDIAAIAQLSDSVARQLELMIKMFGHITDIELNIKEINKIDKGISIGDGGQLNVQNNYVLGGTTADVIKQIRDKKS